MKRLLHRLKSISFFCFFAPLPASVPPQVFFFSEKAVRLSDTCCQTVSEKVLSTLFQAVGHCQAGCPGLLSGCQTRAQRAPARAAALRSARCRATCRRASLVRPLSHAYRYTHPVSAKPTPGHRHVAPIIISHISHPDPSPTCTPSTFPPRYMHRHRIRPSSTRTSLSPSLLLARLHPMASS